jgi:hypothetical protein
METAYSIERDVIAVVKDKWDLASALKWRQRYGSAEGIAWALIVERVMGVELTHCKIRPEIRCSNAAFVRSFSGGDTLAH